MTNQELENRLSAIEQDIADIKEAISTMGGVETADSTDLRTYLEQQVATLQNNDAYLDGRLTTIENNLANNTFNFATSDEIKSLEAKAHTLELEGTTLKITI